MEITPKIEASWLNELKDEFKKDYFKEIKKNIINDIEAWETIYPSMNLIFNAFEHTHFNDLKVVILWQDPYHGIWQAHWLCFSVQDWIKKPPSLKNIFKELKSDLNISIPENWNLKTSLSLFSTVNWKYPEPTNWVDIQYNWWKIWNQWTFWKDTIRNIRIISSVPKDPLYNNEFTYSVTTNRMEYEIAWIVESDLSYNNIFFKTSASNWTKVYIDWNYNWLIAKTNILWTTYVLATPSIISTDLTNTNIENIINNNKLTYKNYTSFPSSYKPYIENWNNSFNFSPNNIIVFSWSLNDLNDTNNQIAFLENIQNSYYWTNVINDSSIIRNIVNFDSTENRFKTLACNVINFSLKHFVECNWLDFLTYYVINILHIDINNLPWNKIEVVFQDSLWNYWFWTNWWIALYDWINWIIYDKNNSDLINDHITSITEDNNWFYWFGTVNWISKFDWSTWINYSWTTLVNTHIQYLYSNSDWTVRIWTNWWVTTYNDETWNNYTKKTDWLSHNNITAIYQDSDENIWFWTNSKWVDKYFLVDWEWEISNYKWINTSNWLPNNKINYIYEDNSNNVWFGTNWWLWKLTWDSDNPSNWTPYTNINTGYGLIHDKIRYIFEDNSNNLWFGTEWWISKYDWNSTWTSYTTSEWLLWNIIYAIFKEDNWNILILNNWWMNTIDNNWIIH